MTQKDQVDTMVGQWERECPGLGLDLEAMGIAARLGRFVLLAERRVEATFAAHGLRRGEFDVLATLRRSGAPYELIPSALADALLMTRAGITSRIDRLESAGLVRRRIDPEDRRSVRVALTEAGRELTEAVVAAHSANEGALLAPLAGEERVVLDLLLRKLLAGVEEGSAVES
ncbi:MarR family winged helix-turn-helix transcriptional regulator [Streptomyces sp. NPDC101118]|uniref:MarR family winged helix-turn-helix transcriptional regulator n=1 Tax=Streptomyces sp. NPDC101118 TaxID=3366109 RepID=UPI0037F1C672